MKLYLKLLFISMISFIYAECSEIDNQDDCERFEWCEWIESDNVPNGGVCTGEWEDDEDGEDDEEQLSCEELNYQLECEATSECEWVDGACQSKDDSGGALENGTEIKHSLLKNYPNPFNPSTNISFSIMNPTKVSLKIYNLSGKEVSQLIDDFYMSGNYNIQWDAKDIYGNQLSSGIYIYRLSTQYGICLLYTSPSPRDISGSRMPSSA